MVIMFARRGVSRLMPWMDGLCVYLLLVWVSCDSDEDGEGMSS